MNPDQLFITNAITRRGIAESLNDHLESMDLPRSIADNDDRLTDEVCREYAKEIGDIDPDLDEDAIAEVADEINHNLLVKLGLIGKGKDQPAAAVKKPVAVTVRGTISEFLASNKVAREMDIYDFMTDLIRSIVEDEVLTLDDLRGYLDSLYEGDRDS